LLVCNLVRIGNHGVDLLLATAVDRIEQDFGETLE
jgi:hypothetical protein